jgi:hypothetical protein
MRVNLMGGSAPPLMTLTPVRPSASTKVRCLDRPKLAPPETGRHPSQVRTKNEAPGGDHEYFDWVAIGEQDGVELDERGAYVSQTPCTTNKRPYSAWAHHIENGVLDTPCQVLFYLTFDGFPIWLLALDATLMSKVCINEHEHMRRFLRVNARTRFQSGLAPRGHCQCGH